MKDAPQHTTRTEMAARAGRPAIEIAPGGPAAATSGQAGLGSEWQVRGGKVDWDGQLCRFCRFSILYRDVLLSDREFKRICQDCYCQCAAKVARIAAKTARGCCHFGRVSLPRGVCGVIRHCQYCQYCHCRPLRASPASPALRRRLTMNTIEHEFHLCQEQESHHPGLLSLRGEVEQRRA